MKKKVANVSFIAMLFSWWKNMKILSRSENLGILAASYSEDYS